MVVVRISLIAITLIATPCVASPATGFRLVSEVTLDEFGGIPFCVDLDGDRRSEILWLQSPGLFHSLVFDVAPWKGRWSEAERNHFCLTATDSSGKRLWQVGNPWRGKRPFVTHSAERALDTGDIDGDGVVEVVCVRRNEILVIDARSGKIERSLKTETDNVQIVQVARTSPSTDGWTILAKNAERAYPPHEYANPSWFYTWDLRLIKKADYLGAGHTPLVGDFDDDGFDEFLIGFNLVDHDLKTRWTFRPVEESRWNAQAMHVDQMTVGTVNSRQCVGLAASDQAYLLDAKTGKLIWKRSGTHPQQCQIGRFLADSFDSQLFVHNKRAALQLFDATGRALWKLMPGQNFPLGQAEPCRRQKFHVFDPTVILPGFGDAGTDLLIFTDAGWPYVLDGSGKRVLDFPYTHNSAQDWGEVPGRPDDYGYGYYARIAQLDRDGEPEVLLNDRRFAWFYDIKH